MQIFIRPVNFLISLYIHFLPDYFPDCICNTNRSLCSQSYSVFVHVAPDSSCYFTGEQDDQAGEELQDTMKQMAYI